MSEAKRIGKKRERFLDLYLGECLYNASEAAEKAGYKSPRQMGSWLTKVLAKQIEEREVVIREKLEVSAAEVRQILTTVARDGQHKDQVRALDILAKIQGQYSDKVAVAVERKTLERDVAKALDELLGGKSAPNKQN